MCAQRSPPEDTLDSCQPAECPAKAVKLRKCTGWSVFSLGTHVKAVPRLLYLCSVLNIELRERGGNLG